MICIYDGYPSIYSRCNIKVQIKEKIYKNYSKKTLFILLRYNLHFTNKTIIKLEDFFKAIEQRSVFTI